MKTFAVCALVCLAQFVASISETEVILSEGVHLSAWVVNHPAEFQDAAKFGELQNVKSNAANMTQFVEMSDYFLERTDAFTDGEVVDALEHYFWGMRDGVAMELGALDGSPATRSMTCEYERSLNWKRVLIEGNPTYRAALIKNSPLAFSVNAAICSTPSVVHFSHSEYVGGIVEFMGQGFMKEYHPKVYNACKPPGNLSSLDFSTIKDLVKPVECIPLSHVLRKAQVKHINYFILDVEGGELEVLKSINWAHIKFDVLCVETEEINRPKGYAAQVTEYLSEKGYKNVTMQQGRNTWYTAIDFVPSRRPGLDPQCFNGARKSDNADKWYADHKYPKFVRCPM